MSVGEIKMTTVEEIRMTTVEEIRTTTVEEMSENVVAPHVKILAQMLHLLWKEKISGHLTEILLPADR